MLTKQHYFIQINIGKINHNYESFDVWFKEIQSKVGMIHDNTSKNPTSCHIFYYKINKSNTAKQMKSE